MISVCKVRSFTFRKELFKTYKMVVDLTNKFKASALHPSNIYTYTELLVCTLALHDMML